MAVRNSVFKEKSLTTIYKEIQGLYLADSRPWVLGYSGGKDSTCALQLLWYALKELPKSKLKKPVHIITSNTLIESPPLLEYVARMHDAMKEKAKEDKLPFKINHLKPKIEDTFWVNLLGKGYPAPQKIFRWCTDRLKIRPADEFILNTVNKYGEVILVLGVRSEESISREQSMKNYKIEGSILSKHNRFSHAFVYTPIEKFTVDDVWNYLLQVKSPWGASNRELLSLYSSKDSGECPLVVDKDTPSCGGSRFGCWTCTLVQKDQTMQNLVDSGQEWMRHLLDIRDFLFKTTDPKVKDEVREFKGRNGHVRFKANKEGEIARGPYKLTFRKELLKKILSSQKIINDTYKDVNYDLITDEELHEIRRLWIIESGDWEDSLPKIYHDVMDSDLDWVIDDSNMFNKDENKLLDKLCQKDKIPTKLVMNLLDAEKELQNMTRRSTIVSKIDTILGREWRSEEEVVKEYFQERGQK